MQQQHRFSHWLSSSLALLLCLMVGLALPVRPVQAATISVTNTNDSGPGSLRQAIADAAPGDTITFALPNPSTITLSSELVIAKNLTITGPGAAALTISGNNATRVFFINPGAVGATSGPPATALTVQITNLTIANGRAQGGAGGEKSNAGGSGGAAGMGGAIFTNNGNLTISGVIFRANQAQGGNGAGGGESFFGAAGGGGVGGNGGEGVFAGGAGGSGGALGGNGGAGGAAGIFLPPGSNGGAGAAGGEGAGGGGGGIGGDCPQDELGRCTGPGANGGNGGSGGFGGGGGGGGSSGRDVGSAIGGNGGNGGFGGGGGGGGGNQGVGASSAGGVGGSFGGNGSSSSRSRGGSGGGGAGLGGAIFVRAGSLTLVDSSLIDNRAAGGSGAQNGQGKGGALFILTPATLHLSGCITFSGNSATDAAGSANDTHDRYGSVASTTPCDSTGPVITPNVVGTLGSNGWYTSDVTVSWTVVDNESAISSQSGCDPVTVNADTAGDTFTCAATSSGGSSSQSVTLKRDATAPTISAAASSTPNANGWYNSNVTVQFTCNDNLSGVVSCPADETLSSEGSAVSSTAQTITDQAGNSSAASNSVTVQIDKTAPVVTVTGVSDGASYTVGSVHTAGCSTTDALSGVATQATTSVTGGNPDGTGSFTATCSGATDLAGNSSSASVSYTVNAPVDACTTSALRDNFNRANGGLGSNWAGATNQSFYKIAGNRVNVQLGGPVLWKPTTFGVNQAAFVTLSALDALSPSQGVLLKVQGGTIPNAGAIAVVYDSLAKAVRVSTLRLNTPTWTVYGNTPATFANGDQLLGCVQADGTVRVYRNNSLLTTVTLNATDQSFFNAKGGKIGLWTVAAFNAFVDDFGGGALTGVSSATLDATTVPDETADDGTEITVAENFPTDDTAAAPDDVTLVNRAFLPLVNR